MIDKNKKLPKSPRHKKTAIFVVGIIILAVAVAVLGFFIAKTITEKNANSSTPTKIQSSEKSKTDLPQESTIPDTSTNTNATEREKIEPNPQTPPQYEGENPNNLDTLTGAISFIGETGGVFSVRVSIDQSVTGTCEFNIVSSNGVTYNESVNTELGPTSTFCVYTGSTPVTSGKWTANIKVKSSDGRSGTIQGDTNI